VLSFSNTVTIDLRSEARGQSPRAYRTGISDRTRSDTDRKNRNTSPLPFWVCKIAQFPTSATAQVHIGSDCRALTVPGIRRNPEDFVGQSEFSISIAPCAFGARAASPSALEQRPLSTISGARARGRTASDKKWSKDWRKFG
jgi:hypothetical protein